MLNLVILSGRLTKQPELRIVKSGDNSISVANFTIAIPRYTKQGEATDFVDVVAWRSLAERVASTLDKGFLVSVVGRIKPRFVQTKKGPKIRQQEIVAREVRILSKPRRNGRQEELEEELQELPPLIEEELDEEDIPF